MAGREGGLSGALGSFEDLFVCRRPCAGAAACTLRSSDALHSVNALGRRAAQFLLEDQERKWQQQRWGGWKRKRTGAGRSRYNSSRC